MSLRPLSHRVASRDRFRCNLDMTQTSHRWQVKTYSDKTQAEIINLATFLFCTISKLCPVLCYASSIAAVIVNPDDVKVKGRCDSTFVLFSSHIRNMRSCWH